MSCNNDQVELAEAFLVHLHGHDVEFAQSLGSIDASARIQGMDEELVGIDVLIKVFRKHHVISSTGPHTLEI